MQHFHSTKEVAERLGVRVARLSRAIYEDRVDAPARGPGGRFLWTEADVERASWQLLGRAPEAVRHD